MRPVESMVYIKMHAVMLRGEPARDLHLTAWNLTRTLAGGSSLTTATLLDIASCDSRHDRTGRAVRRRPNGILLMLLALLLPPSVTWAELLTGPVVGIADGDTLTVLEVAGDVRMQRKVRLSGIDAPEKKQPFGNVSKQALSDLVWDKTVSVEWSKADRYGRIIGKVLVDGKDVNIEMVRLGMAWVYRKYLGELEPADQDAYLAAERAAVADQRGLWRDPEPIPPWEWRKR
jgi:endonuclease YncB( thermonuclease family)